MGIASRGSGWRDGGQRGTHDGVARHGGDGEQSRVRERGKEGENCDNSCTCKLGTLFVSVKYMLVSVKLVCVYVKLLKI
jgi:hypothetical protein